MKFKIVKWGNSAAIRLPSAILTQIGANIGDAIEVDPSAFSIAKLKYKLSDLLEECDKERSISKELEEWKKMPPIGKEIIK